MEIGGYFHTSSALLRANGLSVFVELRLSDSAADVVALEERNISFAGNRTLVRQSFHLL
jgi:hypothetical protein